MRRLGMSIKSLPEMYSLKRSLQLVGIGGVHGSGSMLAGLLIWVASGIGSLQPCSNRLQKEDANEPHLKRVGVCIGLGGGGIKRQQLMMGSGR